jgi:hypothetical protein
LALPNLNRTNDTRTVNSSINASKLGHRFFHERVDAFFVGDIEQDENDLLAFLRVALHKLVAKLCIPVGNDYSPTILDEFVDGRSSDACCCLNFVCAVTVEPYR